MVAIFWRGCILVSNSRSIPFVGLTGGIGSGKTAVSTLFGQLGVPVIDTDIISHQLSELPGFITQVRAIFGHRVFDTGNQQIDRSALRAAFFASREKKNTLEAFFHPLIKNEAIRQMDNAKGSYGILVVPLLFEKKNYLPLLKRTLLVDCPREIQIRRVQQRSGLSEQEICAIIDQQLSREEKLRCADDIIENNRDMAWLTAEVRRLHLSYLDRFAQQTDK